MKKAIYTIAVLMTLIFSSVSLAAIPVDVTVGKGTVLTLKRYSARVSLSDPSVADLILISPSELLINGKKVGTTGLIIWDRSGERTFFNINVMGNLDELEMQVNSIAPDADITVENVSGSVLLKGTVRSEDTIDKIFTISQQYSGKVINFLKVKAPQQVLLEVKVAQIDRTKLNEFGLGALYKGDRAEGTAPGFIGTPGGNLGGDTPGYDVTPGMEGFSLTDIVPQIGVTHYETGIAAMLRAIAAQGLGTILAEPNLVVRSGEKGSFLAGSKIPIQQVTGTAGAQTVSIVYRDVGVKLNFEPSVLDDGTIRLKIDPAEVSNINQFLTFGNIIAPQIDTREVRTSVDLKEGESLILAGLLSEEMKKNIQKIPLLGDIPILGALFRSTREELERTELVFFITPRLVEPIAAGEDTELLKEKLTSKEEREFRWIPFPGGGGDNESEDEEEKGSEEGEQ